MKMKLVLGMTGILSFLLLVSATVWEGVTDVAFDRDLPRAYSAATNSFPRNTIVDITNLENGKMVRVLVISNLETTGLLARLSQNAADAIDLRHDSTCRIRMTQPSDNISRYTAADKASAANGSGTIADIIADGHITRDEADAADVMAAPDEPSPGANVFAIGETVDAEEADAVARLSTAEEPEAENKAIAADEAEAVEDFIAQVGKVMTDNQPEQRISSGTLALVPAGNRPPSDRNQTQSVSIAAAPGGSVLLNTQPPLTQTAESAAAYALPGNFSPFQAPLISDLEKGKCYVQLGVYSRSDNVEDEISRIGMSYPVAVQNVGTDTSPMFRVLLGPLNQGESGAMLQRFKSIGYADAFVRQGLSVK